MESSSVQALVKLKHFAVGRASFVMADLQEYFCSTDPMVRAGAIGLLRKSAPTGAIGKILSAMKDTDATVRLMAIRSLMTVEPSNLEGVALLGKLAAGDPNSDVKEEAVKAITALGQAVIDSLRQ